MSNTLKTQKALADFGYGLIERSKIVELTSAVIESFGSEKLSSYHQGRVDELNHVIDQLNIVVTQLLEESE